MTDSLLAFALLIVTLSHFYTVIKLSVLRERFDKLELELERSQLDLIQERRIAHALLLKQVEGPVAEGPR